MPSKRIVNFFKKPQIHYDRSFLVINARSGPIVFYRESMSPAECKIMTVLHVIIT